MSQQLVKKGANGRMEHVNPKSWIEAIKDKNTGQTLVEMLQGFNMYFLPYNGNTSSTRCLVPTMLRKKGLWITYVKYDGNVYTEWYAADELDDKSWGDSSNWRIGNNTLVGDITISANGNWVINGTETEFKAVGEKGNTPLIRVANNRLQVSYDLGDTYRDVTNNPVYTQFRTYNNKLQVSYDLGATWTDASEHIAAWFRWQATTGDTQANNVGRIQMSRDNGKTWTNMSNDFINNLHISRYIGVNESLPTSGIVEGTIYAKGPYYAEDDTLNDNPIYRLWVYAWKGNNLAWQDNGEFQSIAAGVVQETGNSETEVMSQKAVTEKLSELDSKVAIEETYIVKGGDKLAINIQQEAVKSISFSVESKEDLRANIIVYKETNDVFEVLKNDLRENEWFTYYWEDNVSRIFIQSNVILWVDNTVTIAKVIDNPYLAKTIEKNTLAINELKDGINELEDGIYIPLESYELKEGYIDTNGNTIINEATSGWVNIEVPVEGSLYLLNYIGPKYPSVGVYLFDENDKPIKKISNLDRNAFVFAGSPNAKIKLSAGGYELYSNYSLLEWKNSISSKSITALLEDIGINKNRLSLELNAINNKIKALNDGIEIELNTDNSIDGFINSNGGVSYHSNWKHIEVPILPNKNYILSSTDAASSVGIYQYYENGEIAKMISNKKEVKKYIVEGLSSSSILKLSYSGGIAFKLAELSDNIITDWINIINENIRKDTSDTVIATKNEYYSYNDVGCIQYQEIGSTEYCQGIVYGQSLSIGWEAPIAISTTPLEGNYMLGSSPWGHGNENSVLNPLVAVASSGESNEGYYNSGEQPIVGAVNAFSSMWRRFRNPSQKFIANNVGTGQQSIELLSKNCTNNNSQSIAQNRYHTDFLALLNNTKSCIDKMGSELSCSFIIYMQGEHNYAGSGLGLIQGSEATRDKDEYKALLLQLKNDMQSDIMNVYGQSKKPLFFIYQTAGNYVNRKDCSISQAQMEFALENEDVFLLSSTYPCPSYNGGHLSTNGYRMFGELTAKAMYNVFVKGVNFSPVVPMEYIVEETKIKIVFKVPVSPLVLDSYTVERRTNYGFAVYKNGVQVQIDSVVADSNTVTLQCGEVLNGEIEINYGGNLMKGGGNLRDSDTYRSFSDYFDDRNVTPNKMESYTPKDKNGNYLYGKSYPMYNWCANFYKLIQL